MHYLWLLHRKEMFRPVNANEQNEFPNCPVGCLCWFWVTVTRTPPSICDPVWVQLDNIDTCGGNVSIAEQFWHVRCWLPLNLNLWLRSVKIMMMRVGVGGVRHPQHTQTSSNSVTVWQIPDAIDRVICASDDGWRYHPKHVEQFPDKINCVTLHLIGYILEYSYDARTHER